MKKMMWLVLGAGLVVLTGQATSAHAQSPQEYLQWYNRQSKWTQQNSMSPQLYQQRYGNLPAPSSKSYFPYRNPGNIQNIMYYNPNPFRYGQQMMGWGSGRNPALPAQ